MSLQALRSTLTAMILLILPIVNYGQESQSLTGRATGTIVGTVKDSKNESLPGVTIKVESGTAGAVTDVDGSYRLVLSEGKYNLTYSYISFETKRITDVEVKAGDITDLNIVLQEGTGKTVLNEVVVTATYRQASVEGLYNKQRNNSAISDGISAEQIRRTPDNNAAQVLRRVSGLTIQDNKFVTVRGMSERYNNVTLNGSMLPSTEPNRRNFSFDILPSNMIDNIIVNKTATPDMPGEFAGGTVQVMTKDIPDNNVVSASVSTGYNTNTIGKPIQSLKRENSEWSGNIGKDRDWWWGKFDESRYKNGLANNDYRDLTAQQRAAIPNNWGLYEYRYNPVQQYQAMIGRIIPLKKEKGTIGITAAGNYRHEEYATDIERLYRVQEFDLSGKEYEFITSMAGIANVAYQNKNSKIGFKNIYTRRLNHTARVLSGLNINGGVHSDAYTDGVSANDMYQNKLEGEHVLTARKIKITWSLDRSHMTRDQPDLRNSVTQDGSYKFGEGLLDFTKGGMSILNAHLEETRLNYSANVTIPFRVLGAEQKVKAGFLNSSRNATYTFAGMKTVFVPGAAGAGNMVENRPDYFVANPQFINENGLYYHPAGPSDNSNPESYTGDQHLLAAYAMVDLKINKNIRFIGGARMEQNDMNVHTATYTFNNGSLDVQDLTTPYKNTNLLPSFNLVYSLTKKANLRAAYSKTLTRPDFRERSAFQYYDFYDYITVYGATGLKDTKIDNADLRFEYYPSPGEVFSTSLFYKKFTSPVEMVQQRSGSGGTNNFYFNLESSTNYGFEADFRKSLDFIRPGSIARNFYVSGNFTYMISEVNFNIDKLLAAAGGLDPKNVDPNGNRKRPLQGLSPYIINGALGYQSKTIGAQITYNRIGQRIAIAGPNDFEDQYEVARDVLDMQVSKRLWKNRIDVRLNISDLLQQPFIIYQNFDQNKYPGSLPRPGESVDPGPKKNAYDKGHDLVRSKTYRGSNISLTVALQL